jgi:U-box domain
MISIGSDGKIKTDCCSMVEVARALDVDVPSEFICPITMDVMQRPLMAISGFNFEHDAIMKWINTTSNTCPLTRQELRTADLFRNKALEKRISMWIWENCLPPFTTVDGNKNDDGDDNKVENNVVVVGYVRVPERRKRYFREKILLLRSSRTSSTAH